MEGRAGHGKEHRGSHQLPHGYHPRRTDRRKGVGADPRADLVADPAARHGQDTANH